LEQREKPSLVTAKFVHEDKAERQEEYSDSLASLAKKAVDEGALRYLANGAKNSAWEIDLKGRLSDQDYGGQNLGTLRLEGEVPNTVQPGLYRHSTIEVEFSDEEAQEWLYKEAPNNFEAVMEWDLEGAPNDFKEVPNLRLRIANPYELKFEGWKWGDRSRWEKLRFWQHQPSR
jgi:hypothetical protein